MNRKEFLKALTIVTGVTITIPTLLLEKEKNVLVFDGVDSLLDLSKFYVYYDFTKPEYGIYDHKGLIIGWKDISGHSRDARILTSCDIRIINIKKIAISDKCDNLVEYL